VSKEHETVLEYLQQTGVTITDSNRANYTPNSCNITKNRLWNLDAYKPATITSSLHDDGRISDTASSSRQQKLQFIHISSIFICHT